MLKMLDFMFTEDEVLSARTIVGCGIAAYALSLIMLLFGGFFWFLNSYNDNVTVIQGVQSRISDQESKTLQGIQAGKRKRYYIETSPSSVVSDAKIQYIAWLKKTFREDIGVNLNRVDPGKNAKLKFESKVVAEQMSFTIRPTLKLEQLVSFLNAFYSVDSLHRIRSLTLTPKPQAAGRKRIRTGELTASIEIQVLSLPDGVEQRELKQIFRDPGISPEKAFNTIVRRDVFGAANNSPTLKVNKSSSYTSGKSISIKVSARDADEEDKLAMELLESEVSEADLQIDSNGKTGKLIIPGQPAGKYTFVIRVTDNGLPSKSTDEEVVIAFKDPKKPKVEKKPPKPPALKKALNTFITANLKNADGSWTVLIKSRMDGKSYRLKSGESFKLDNRSWEVLEITRVSATFFVDGQEVVVKRGVAFSEVDLPEDEDIEDLE